ncbi:MAG: hypothetical protein AAGJ54_07185 [Planctomycetota bacterium]
MAKTMKKSDVIFGQDHSCNPANWGGRKGAMEQAVLMQSGQRVPSSKLSAAKKIIDSHGGANWAKSYSAAYWLVGWIGNDLVFRLRSKRKGPMAAKGYTSSDVVLFKRDPSAKPSTSSNGKAAAKPKAGSTGSSDTVTIKLPTMVMWNASTAPTILQHQEFVDKLDKGQIRAVASITLPKDTPPSLQKRCKAIAVTELDAVAESVEQRMNKLAKDMVQSRGAEAKLGALAKAAGADIEALTDDDVIEAAIATKCEEVLSKDKAFRALHTEFKVRVGFKVVGQTVKTALATTRLILSSGTDASSYLALARVAKSVYDLVEDIRKTEPALRKTLLEAIEDFERMSEHGMKEIKSLYDDARDEQNSSSLWSKLLAAAKAGGRGTDRMQQDFQAAVKVKLGKKFGVLMPSPDKPETARRRYVTDIGKKSKSLDAEYKKLEAAKKKFSTSQIQQAVTLWSTLGELDTACGKAVESLEDQLTFAEEAEDKIKDLGISTSNLTTPEKISAAWKAIKKAKFSDAAPGAAALATDLSTAAFLANNARKLANEIAKAAK